MNSFKMTNYDFVRNVTCPRQKIEAIIFKTIKTFASDSC